MNTHFRQTSLALTIVLLSAVACKARPTADESALQSRSEPTKVLTPGAIATWPATASGQPVPLMKMPGIIVGVTPDRSREFNTAAADALKRRGTAKLLAHLQEGRPMFFIAAVVNAENVSLFARPLVGRALKNQGAAEIEAYYQAEFAPWRNNKVLETSLLAINDGELATHHSLGLRVPAAPGASAPLSVVVVAKSGGVYGPFALSGSAATDRELDVVFEALDGLL